MLRVLVVCTGNTCRSPMAEWILRAMLDKQGLSTRVTVTSGGLSAIEGAALSDGARRVLQARALPDACAHQARRVTKASVEAADLILTMTSFHKMSLAQAFTEASSKVYTLAEYAQQGEADIADPYGGDDTAYEEAAERIADACAAIVDRLHRELGKSQGVPLQ